MCFAFSLYIYVHGVYAHVCTLSMFTHVLGKSVTQIFYCPVQSLWQIFKFNMKSEFY